MSRLVEIDDVKALPRALTLQVGDILLFRATGGHVLSDDAVVEILGFFLPAVIGPEGQVLSPMGPPAAVLFRARSQGRAMIDVVTSDPSQQPSTSVIELTVQS